MLPSLAFAPLPLVPVLEREPLTPFDVEFIGEPLFEFIVALEFALDEPLKEDAPELVAEGVPEEPLELVDCATAAPPAMPAAARATAASF